MKLYIYHNELDASEFDEKEYECLLKEWMSIREEYPIARLYKDSICAQNDVTPKTKEEALKLLDADGDYFILCHAGTPFEIFLAVVTVMSLGLALYTYLNIPEAPEATTGSGNNSLASRQNKHRTNERVPDVYGTRLVVPDLIAPIYRYYENNIQVEECLMCLGAGYFDVSNVKESDTPIDTIEGASFSLYEPSTILTATPQIQIGEAFEAMPIVAKQVSAIDGKKTLIPPNSAQSKYTGVSFSGNKVSVYQDAQGIETDYNYQILDKNWITSFRPVFADFTANFSDGEQIIIENAIFGDVPDVVISGTTNISTNGILTVASTLDITDPNNFKKIRVVSLLVNDATNGQLDLAGEYTVSNIVKSGSFVYEIQLSNFVEVNPNFSLLQQDAVAVMSGVLTDNDDNIDLSGTYTISTVSTNELVLVNPSAVNADWNKLDHLSAQQIQQMLSKQVTFKGSDENWIGWYYAGNKDTTGMILNFLANNGIYEGDRPKKVYLEVQYQQIVNNVPTGPILVSTGEMQGKANNRDAIGTTIRSEMPFSGQFRFRAKRVNDNGNGANLIDDVVFESAYAFYETTKQAYPLDTIIRLKRLAIGSGTNASELNMIATRKLYSYADGYASADMIATNNFADIITNVAIDPYIGRFDISEIDIESLYATATEIQDYFGTSKACEFNYTFDDKNTSYQEIAFTIAEAVFCTARRENGLHYFRFERETVNSTLLFNHRNTKPESMTIGDVIGIEDDYEGVEFKWRDANDNYAEATLKLPHDGFTNYKTIESTGITNGTQAHLLANRVWNKLKYNRVNLEFTAYGEADLVTRNDRIAVVDETTKRIGSGEISNQNNTVLTLSDAIELDADQSYSIHLQLKDSSVDVIDIVRQINPYQVEIARIPLIPLVVVGVVNAVYSITLSSKKTSQAYLIQEKAHSATFESTITAIQYDSRYYSNDKDFINNLI